MTTVANLFSVPGKDGSPRHVVRVLDTLSDGRVLVQRVCLHPKVSGVAKRGKPPSFSNPLSVDELLAFSDEEMTADVQRSLDKLNNQPTTEQETENDNS